MIGLWIPAAIAVGLLALALGWLRGPVPFPASLILAFLGLALCPFGRTPQSMKLLDWMLIGPYLLAVGCAFGRDIQISPQPWMTPLMAGAACLAALMPHARLPGVEAPGFALMVLLYSATLVVRPSVPPQEVALFAAAAILRVALSRVRRIEAAAGRRRNSVAWLVLAPAVRSGLLAAALILLSNVAVTQAARLRVALDPQIRALAAHADALSDRARDSAREARKWFKEWYSNLPPPEAPVPKGLIETLLSGQQPLPPGPVPGFDLQKPIRVQEPDRLRFDRDLRERLEMSGPTDDFLLASVRSARPLPYAPYLRRAVFEVYENGSWSFPDPTWTEWSDRTILDAPGRTELWVTSEPGSAGEIFVPSPFLGSYTETPLRRDRSGNLRAGLRVDGPVTISAATSFGPFDWRIPAGTRFAGGLYQVPSAILADPAFRQALDAVRRRASRGEPLPLAAAAYCRETFRYTRSPEHREDADPVLEFLRTGRGFCQHYASLCALVLRAEGIPCRLGAGLAFGAPREGAWVYGLDNGHAWVEIWIEGFGWVPLDPTAGAINLDTGAASPPNVGSGPVDPPRPPGTPQTSGRTPAGDTELPLTPAPGARSLDVPADVPANPRGDLPPVPRTPVRTPDLDRLDHEALRRLQTRTPFPAASALDAAPGPPPTSRPSATPAMLAAASPAPFASPTPLATPAAVDPSGGVSGLGPGLPPEATPEDLLTSTLRRLVDLGDWIALGLGAAFCLGALFGLRRRVRVEESLGDRPGLPPEEADREMAWLRLRLQETRSPREAVRLLFEMFSRQMAAWGYGRLGHETERDFALAVDRAVGRKDGGSLDGAVSLVEEACYGGLVPSQPQLDQLDRSLVDILLTVGRRLGLRAEGLGGLWGRRGWLPKKSSIVN